MKKLVSLFALLLFTSANAFAAPPSIYVADPPENRTVAFDHVLFEGSVPAGASFSIDGRAIDVGRDGLFIEWLPLKQGLNVLHLESKAGIEYSKREFRIVSEVAAPLSATPTTIAADSVKPSADWKSFNSGGSLQSRTIDVSFRGLPNGSATFMVGNRGPFAMTERKAEDFPGAKNVAGGTYEGSFVVDANDQLDGASIVVSLTGSDGKTATQTATGKLTVSPTNQLRVGIVTVEAVGLGVNASTTVARNGAGRSHVLQLKAGEKFIVTGEDGATYRCLLSPNQSVNILKTQMRLLPIGAPLPRVYFSRIETRIRKSSTQFDTEVRFELPDRVPFSIEQTANENDQSLDLRLFNTESDVDYFVSAFPDELVENVTWTQESDGVFHARIFLKTRQQWGFQSFYDGNTLVVRIKHVPKINRRQPLLGRSIVIDAGHGGSESGAPGAFGVDEKDLVLDIARRLTTKLQKRGATVTMTRDKDVQVPIYNRPLQAEKLNADVLMSIHANALPDGVDPNGSRGAGVYFYQPQARPLAESLLGALLHDVPEDGNDGLHYQNLALTRPGSQLSVLVETAFMTDKSNLRLLMSESGRERIAESLARGLEEFYRVQNTRR